MISIVIVDDHNSLVESLTLRLGMEQDFSILGSASNVELGLELMQQHRPDILILDLELQGRGSLFFSEELARPECTTKVLVYSGHSHRGHIELALRLGARGYLHKSESIAMIIGSIRKVAKGEYAFSPQVASLLSRDPRSGEYSLVSPSPLADLTTRQLEVLRYLAQGTTVRQAAEELHISPKSIDSHKYRIMQKLGIHDRVELARFAIREGLLLP